MGVTAAGLSTFSGGATPATAIEPTTSAFADARQGSLKRYKMKKSINQWAFPYPQRMNLEECLKLAKRAGFDGIELNYDLENDLSPKASASELAAIRKLADKIGIEISGLCSFLFWPYPLTSNDESKRARGLELAEKMGQAAFHMGFRTCWWFLVPCTSLGATTMSRSPMTYAIDEPGKPLGS